MTRKNADKNYSSTYSAINDVLNIQEKVQMNASFLLVYWPFFGWLSMLVCTIDNSISSALEFDSVIPSYYIDHPYVVCVGFCGFGSSITSPLVFSAFLLVS